MKNVPPRNKIPHTKIWLILLLVVLPLACTLLGSPIGGADETPVNGWKAARGPVVPHDKFPDDCRICHQGDGWHKIREDFRFDHEKETGTALHGAHKSAECLRCHNDRGPVVSFAARGCSGCHEDWHKGQLGTDCGSCHDERTWQAKDVISKHAMTRFPLVGAHAGVGCWACHPGAQVGDFKRASTDCITCHRETLAQAKSPDHLANGWTQDCQRCHSPTTWKATGFVHQFFPLTGEHKAALCTDCHKNGQFQGLSQDCASCHGAAYRAATNPNHMQAGFSTDCRKCHGSSGWKGANFRHPWPLIGEHLAVTCEKCHTGGNYKAANKDCISCHRDTYNNTQNPNHKLSGFSTDCAICHKATGWEGSNFAHRWPLTGAHAGKTCEICHKGRNFKAARRDCVSCHRAEYDRAKKPDHRRSGFSTECSLCHNTTGWSGANFTHKWPLQGAHAALSCTPCHQGGVFRGISSQCIACHQKDFDRTNKPNHKKAGFSTDCTRCHNSNGWGGANFQHRWPLLGAHKMADCTKCHKNQVYRGTPKDCYACHKAEYDRTTKPNHKNASFSTNCAQCHNSVGWQGANFQHRWPLTGAHKAVSCASCHKNQVYKGTPKDCYACHKADFDKTTNPNHRTSGFTTQCTLCHTTATWKGARFDHKWPLKGGHSGLSCTKCHINNVYKGTSKECFSCHKTKYLATTKPNHQKAGFSTQCQTCHTINGWSGANYKHQWPLIGGHLAVPCASCHKNQVYKGTSKDCISCHKADFDKTTNPNHRTLGFSNNCLLCHNMSGWKGAKFNHTWPLTGGHAGVSCLKCHKNNVYKGTSKACYSCHQAKYASTTNPNHQKAGFSTQCQTCHNINTWKGAQYSHKWPLTGAHRSTSCIKCHKNQVYKGTPTTCYACHKTQYDNTTNPNHRGLGYPTNCTSCHTTSAFKPSTFVHKFPLVKKHAVSCKTCHTVPTNFKTFTCIVCHEHNKTKMDKEHKGKKGYVYSSPACYNCHPRGKG